MGAVMESMYHEVSSGMGKNLYARASVPMDDVIMSDGKSLEKVGVTPDTVVLWDVAESKDPVLAHAAKLAGV